MFFIRWLFDFRKPKILHLDFIDVVIADKMLLLLSWRLKRGHSLAIPVIGKKYSSRENAVVLKLPGHVDTVVITVSSFWRKTRYPLYLKKLKLDKGAADLLISRFRPFIMPSVSMKEVRTKKLEASVHLPVVTGHQRSLLVMLRPVLINKAKFTYTTQITYHEERIL